MRLAGKIPFALVFIGALLTSGCGGGSPSTSGGGTGGTNPQGSPQGAYIGTTSTGETFESIILPNSTFYALYGTSSGQIFTVDGMMTGSGSYSNGKYTANVTDYYYAGNVYTGTVSATYVQGASVSGTVSETGNAPVTFTGTVMPATQFNFNTAAQLSDISGSWTGYLFGNALASVTISASGTFTGSTQGCAFSGTITPDPSAENFFDFTIKYGAAPCELANQSQSGIAVEYLLSGGATRQLVAAVTSSSGGDVFIANRAATGTSTGNPKFVQSASFTSQTATSTYTAAFTNPVTSGDLIAVAFWWNFAPGQKIVSVTDNAGNVYSPVIQTSSLDANDWAGWIYTAPDAIGGNNLSVTVTVSAANSQQFSMAILEYSGVANLDVTSTAGGTATSVFSSGYATTNHANEVILGIAVADVNMAAGTGFNSRFVSPYFCVEDKFVSTPGAYDAEFTPLNTIPSEGWDAAMAAFY